MAHRMSWLEEIEKLKNAKKAKQAEVSAKAQARWNKFGAVFKQRFDASNAFVPDILMEAGDALFGSRLVQERRFLRLHTERLPNFVVDIVDSQRNGRTGRTYYSWPNDKPGWTLIEWSEWNNPPGERQPLHQIQIFLTEKSPRPLLFLYEVQVNRIFAGENICSNTLWFRDSTASDSEDELRECVRAAVVAILRKHGRID